MPYVSKIPVLQLLILLSAICSMGSKAQSIQSYDFKGRLQTSSVTAIVQDDLGFIWIGYDNGVARFDGYTAEPLLLNNSERIGYVNSIQNRDRLLYIGTNEGMYIYDYIRNTLKTATPHLQGQNILSFQQTDTLWTVATNNGLFFFDNNWELLYRVSSHEGLSDNRITCVGVSANKRIWVGTESGLDIVHLGHNEINVTNILKGRRIAQIFFDSNNDIWLCQTEEVLVGSEPQVAIHGSSALHRIAYDIEAVTLLQQQNRVWIGTRGAGISQFEIREKTRPLFVKKILIEEDKGDDLKNTTLALLEDNYQNVWMGTLDGLYQYKGEQGNHFHTMRHSLKEKNTPSSNIISSIYYDKSSKHIWLATADGVNKLIWNSKEEYTFVRYIDERDIFNRIANNKIQSIVEYKEDIFLVSTKSSVKFFDSRTTRFFEKEKLNAALQSYGMKYVRSSYRDTENHIWLAFSEGGVGVLNTETEQFYKLELQGESNSKHRSICRDRMGRLWVSSDDDGLYCLTLGQSLNKVTKSKIYSREQFNHHWITSLYIDKQNQIWAGTSNGLYRYDPKTDSFKIVEFPYSRKNLYVSGIIEDFYNNIWVVGLEGVYKISTTNNIQYYQPYSNEEISKTWYILGLNIDANGNIFMGGVNGLTYFNPLEIVPDPYRHTLFISNFEVLNKPILPDGIRLSEDINVSEQITLSHNDYQFSLTFSSLFYPDPTKVEYTYKLEGFDEEWITTDASRRYVSYSNLPSGHYTFLLRSSNASGMWLDNEKRISITIQPSPWKTWWAILIYAIMGLGVVLLVIRTFDLGSKLKYKEALNQWKLKYYINLAYGFKVPLTLIHAPLQSLLKDDATLSEQEGKQLLSIMLRNVKKLSFQISQLIEFRKIDSGKEELFLSETDIIPLITEVFNIFKEEAISKEIEYTFESNVNSIMVTIDSTKIEVALYNILSNAIRHTPVGGGVKMECTLNPLDHKLLVSVSDTGAGISATDQLNIFNRFDRITGKHPRAEISHIGIGLSIAADYIRMHHSQIAVASRLGKGSEFSFYIQLGHAHFSPEELQSLNKADTLSVLPKDQSTISIAVAQLQEEVGSNRPLISLYEGDRDLDNFIKGSLYKRYNVQIVNSSFGIKQLREVMPELIIIDLPYHDEGGLEICKQLKADKVLSSTPVIIISSVSTDEDKQKAYEVGADAYITKPFDLLYLSTRIKQTLDLRKSIKEKVKKELIVNPKEVIITSDDDIFMANVMNVIEENISNTEFNIDNLCDSLNVSRSMLYRKMVQQTNQPPIEFIKKVRLKRAANLLQITSYNIAEISSKVGFSDQRYFSSCFKKEYGMTPKKYSFKQKRKNHSE